MSVSLHMFDLCVNNGIVHTTIAQCVLVLVCVFKTAFVCCSIVLSQLNATHVCTRVVLANGLKQSRTQTSLHFSLLLPIFRLCTAVSLCIVQLLGQFHYGNRVCVCVINTRQMRQLLKLSTQTNKQTSECVSALDQPLKCSVRCLLLLLHMFALLLTQWIGFSRWLSRKKKPFSFFIEQIFCNLRDTARFNHHFRTLCLANVRYRTHKIDTKTLATQ